ncbi:hypothetical protein I3843_13G033400 [Carya illinoinensis]|nr:hypothetical protein I3843_13G033400 [Carya illinoinensis]KAG7948911.1 hypothetical protein I3843_13G033400 [Carya illinoinensis]
MAFHQVLQLWSELECESVFAFESAITRRSSRGLGGLRGYTNRTTCCAGFSVRYRTPMPSVGMRRTTRVFGVVKGLDGGARVLRSGRRLWPESVEGKLRRGNDGEEWFKLVKNPGNNGGLGCKQSGWSLGGVKRVTAVDINDADDCQAEESPICAKNADNVNHSVDKLFGRVYSRKRRGTGTEICDFSLGDSNRMYGRQFFRRQRRKIDGSEGLEIDGIEGLEVFLPRPMLAVVGAGGGSDSFIVSFLYSVLTYMRRAALRLNKLSAFLSSEPIASVYALGGIHFLQDPPITTGSGMCKFFGAIDFIPLFSLDFSTVPVCFMYMHYRMLMRYKCWPFALANNSCDADTSGDMITDSEEDESDERGVYFPSDRDLSASLMEPSECDNMVHEAHNLENRALLHPSLRASKLAGRSAQSRNGLNSRGFRKRRSSLRRGRARNLSAVGGHKPSGAVVSDAIRNRINGMPLSSLVTNNKFRSPVRSSSFRQSKEESSTSCGSRQDVDISGCTANILVIDSDNCHRVEGANIMLEISASREWLLVVKKEGFTRYTQKTEKIMRPCSCNRFTHAILWNLDNGWKLEFPNRMDWLTFKDLYKECSDRNVLAPAVKNIPVPGVLEVLDYGNNNTTFCRPDLYISIKDDEVSRAMARSTPNYDMDSEDEKWLEKFNNEYFTGNDIHRHVSEDAFELMVDKFEKAYYCHPDDFPDEKAAANLCLGLARSEVVEAVNNYWMKKRKQKGSALVRVFQGHQAKRAQVIPKPFLRKRRSFKRQRSQLGRGKPPSFLRVIAAEQDALEEKNSMLKVKEANASANRSVELAVLKRKRAQFLMENADLATYRAVMALQISEAARVAESTDATTSYFLD